MVQLDFFHFWHDCWPWPIDYLIKLWSIFVVTLSLNFQGEMWNLLYISAQNGLIATKKKQIYRFNSRPQIWPRVWPWPWPWPFDFQGQMWPWPLTTHMALTMDSCISEWEGRLTLNKGSFITMTVTIWWPSLGLRIYQIVTGVTSDVGVLSTHLDLVIDGWIIHCEIALRWISLDLTDIKSTLVQVMGWCHQAPSHYLTQCWPRSMSPDGITTTTMRWAAYIRC